MSAGRLACELTKAQPAPEPSSADYGLAELPGAPAHVEAMLLGRRFYHAVICAGDLHLIEACGVPELGRRS